MKLPDMSEEALLLPGEPPPVGFHARRLDGPWLFLCEHAGNRIPENMDLLGLPQAEINRHIGWDIGILEVAEGIAGQLKAPLFFQRYSRLVIDCNRPLKSDELIPENALDVFAAESILKVWFPGKFTDIYLRHKRQEIKDVQGMDTDHLYRQYCLRY